MLASLARKLGIRTRRGFRLALRGIAIFFITGCGYAIALLVDFKKYEWSILAFGILLAATLFEFILGDQIAEYSYPIETERKLYLLEQRLGQDAITTISEKLRRIIEKFRACDRSKVCGTVHILVALAPFPETNSARYGLLQLTDYVGPKGGNKGRITTLDQGIIGRCARTGRPEHVNFADMNEYRRRMVEEFGFMEADAEGHTKVGRSYLAEPIKIDSKVVGIVYFFSTEPQVFPLAARDSDLTDKAKDLGGILKVISIV